MSRHVRLDASIGWRAQHTDGVELGSALRLVTIPGAAHPLADDAGTFGGLSHPTGVVVDPDGTLYVADSGRHAIFARDPCTCAWSRLACFGGEGSAPRQLRAPHGLAISPRGELLIADTENERIQVVTLPGVALRAIWNLGWRPFDLVVTPACEVLVSDPDHDRVHIFDLLGRHQETIEIAGRPTHLALDAHARRLYAVLADRGEVVVLAPDTEPELLAVGSDVGPIVFGPDGLLVYADGALCRGGETPVRVRAWRGVCSALAMDGDAVLAAAPGAIRELSGAAFALSGRALIGPIDSGIDRCVWHRLRLGGQLPEGATVTLETFTADRSELPDAPRWRSHPECASLVGGAWDCLVQSRPGRYLWLQIGLAGDGSASPALDWLTVEYPRRTTARFMPAVYRQQPDDADVLDRFLSIFDTIRDGVTAEAARFRRYLDPDAAPAPFLDWLAGWIGLALEARWTEERRRALLKAAPRLYALRGTPAGLRLHLELYTGHTPRILEHFRLRRWLFVDEARLGDDSVLWGDDVVGRFQVGVHAQVGEFQLKLAGDPRQDPLAYHAHRFTVYVPVCGALSAAERATIERIVERAKPAGSAAEVRVVQARMRVGAQSRVGVDTVIGRYPEGVITDETRLRHGSVLGATRTGSSARIGTRARIGSTTRLD